MSFRYKLALFVSWPFVSLIYPRRTFGRQNRPGEGAYLICGNHSHVLDPFFVAYSMGAGRQIHFMAKVEIFRVPVVGPVLKAIGMFPVDREQGGGAAAIKTAMRLLKDGKKVGIFPEGTRIQAEEESEAKTGAVRLAARMGVPIVPVFMARKKRLFRFNPVVIGEPYMVELDKKPTPEDIERAAEDMMERIRALGETLS